MINITDEWWFTVIAKHRATLWKLCTQSQNSFDLCRRSKYEFSRNSLLQHDLLSAQHDHNNGQIWTNTHIQTHSSWVNDGSKSEKFWEKPRKCQRNKRNFIYISDGVYNFQVTLFDNNMSHRLCVPYNWDRSNYRWKIRRIQFAENLIFCGFFIFIPDSLKIIRGIRSVRQ